MTTDVLEASLIKYREDFLVPPGTHAAVDILVENYEHGCRVSPQLPDWKFCYLPSEGRSEEYDDVAKYDERRIVTFRYAERYGLQADIVIRADGTGLKLPNCWPDPGRLIIDIWDNFDQQCQAASKRRHEDYVFEGWHVHEIQPAAEFARVAKAVVVRKGDLIERLFEERTGVQFGKNLWEQ